MIDWSTLSLDADADGRVTIRDLLPWLEHAFFLPGDMLIGLLVAHAPRVAGFLELGPEDVGTALAKGLAVAVWLGGLIVVTFAVGVVRHADRVMTAWIHGRLAGLARASRVLRRRLAGWRRRRAARAGSISVEAVELDPLEAAVLRCHSGLDELSVMSAAGVAAALKLPERRIEDAARRLRELRLLERGFGTDGGSEGHRITRYGQMYLLER